jgi:hypothetical protein
VTTRKWPREWSIAAISAGLVIGIVAGFATGAIQSVVDRVSGHDRGMVGGCTPFNLFAQNQFDPVGTLIWSAPEPQATSRPGFAPNQIVTVDGWARGRSPYITNTVPWNTEAWFHLANDDGWVTFAGVRANPTSKDPTNTGPGSDPAPLDASCLGTPRT